MSRKVDRRKHGMIYVEKVDDDWIEIANDMEYEIIWEKDVQIIKSRAYGDKSEQATPLVNKSWRVHFNFPNEQAKAVINSIGDKQLNVKLYPNRDDLGHWLGEANIIVDYDYSVKFIGSGALNWNA